jgi:hypothetical protein
LSKQDLARNEAFDGIPSAAAEACGLASDPRHINTQPKLVRAFRALHVFRENRCRNESGRDDRAHDC